MINKAAERSEAIEAIKKKLLGGSLTYKEIYAVMDGIAHNKLGDILTTYFAASGYAQGFSDDELYSLTKAMVATGETLHFDGIVADKHSIGGIPGTRTTLIVVPIVAAAGFTIPKSSSRAITTPGGTADDMEVLAPVELSKEQIYDIVKKTNGCIVWGGSFNIAPADDIIIKVEEPLLYESYDKIIVSIMAKKIAFGSTHVVIDIPYGETAKVHTKKDAGIIAEKFMLIAKRFAIKIECMIHETPGPIGKGIGPVLETRDALRVLQQKDNRPHDLEERSIALASTLLALCLQDASKELQNQVQTDYRDATHWAKHLLETGIANHKMQEIIHAQGGEATIDSEDLLPGKHTSSVVAHTHGLVKKINIKNVTIVAKILGAPIDKGAGLYLEKKIGDMVKNNDILYRMYSSSQSHIKEAQDSLKHFPIYTL